MFYLLYSELMHFYSVTVFDEDCCCWSSSHSHSGMSEVYVMWEELGHSHFIFGICSVGEVMCQLYF